MAANVSGDQPEYGEKQRHILESLFIEEVDFKDLDDYSFIVACIDTYKTTTLDESYPVNDDMKSTTLFNLNKMMEGLLETESSKGSTYSEAIMKYYFTLYESRKPEHIELCYNITCVGQKFIAMENMTSYLKSKFHLVAAVIRDSDANDFENPVMSSIARQTKDHLINMLAKASHDSNGKLSDELIDLIVICMERRTRHHFHIIEEIGNHKHAKYRQRVPFGDPGCYLIEMLGSNTKAISWKKHTEKANEVILLWIAPIELPNSDLSGFISIAEEVFMTFMFTFNKDNIEKKITGSLCDLLEYCLQCDSELYYRIGKEIVEFIKLKGHNTKVTAILKAYDELIKRDDFECPRSNEHKFTTLEDTMSLITCDIAESNTTTQNKDTLLSILRFSMEHDLEEINEIPISIWGEICGYIVCNILDKSKTKDINEFAPYLIKLLCCDVERLADGAESTVRSMSKRPEIFLPYINDLIDIIIVQERFCVINLIQLNFVKCTDVIMGHFDEIMEKREDMSSNEMYGLFELLNDVSKYYPERVMPYKDYILSGLDQAITSYYSVAILMTLATYKAEEFQDLDERITELVNEQSVYIYFVNQLIVVIAKYSEASARRMMTLLVGQLNDSRNAPNYKHILASMKEIGTTYIHILREHKELIISFKESAPEVVKESIDLMEGRSLKTVTEQVVYVKGDVDELDDRVTVTQEHISELNITAESTANATVDAIGDIAAHEKRFNELEDKVDDTIQKVEEVDQKTVSNAPSWSVDVSTLLNVEDGRDWRFLAIRLGYLSEDIRQLATAQNPTMSLLSEWYSTHKYREATFAVMTSLKELGRSECVNIIEDALNASGETVLEKPSDLTHPPVFISYQWDHQSEVKTLKEHLEMAGYECWMDIGQMGGGDKLYEKIDEGLRGAKIVLSMCSEKYSHSKNCNHEMSLANLLNKPIVPILLEDIDWPPAGPMGVILSQLLYIKFCPEKEYTRGEKFWTDTSFTELLRQIRYHAVPEHKSSIIELMKKEEDARPSEKPANHEIPDVFISYHCDQQKSINTLYSNLTSLGYACWVDVIHTEGADPLYGKIENAITTAKVLISCCTPKYSLSANCRREVSLADALKKPIIPILLESMEWPPEGLMSMPFAQLEYIDFRDEESKKFCNDKFDDLKQRIDICGMERHEPQADLFTEKNEPPNKYSIPTIARSEKEKTPKASPSPINKRMPPPPTRNNVSGSATHSKSGSTVIPQKSVSCTIL